MATNLTPAEKRQYLMNKYVKRDYKIEDLKPKYAVYFNPSIEKIKEWTLVCVTDTHQESLHEIFWRKMATVHNDNELIIQNDKKFSTYYDETKNVDSNGIVIEPGDELMNIDYSQQNTNMLQIIANSAPTVPSKNGFRGLGYYANISTEYTGIYKIEEFYEI